MAVHEKLRSSKMRKNLIPYDADPSETDGFVKWIDFLNLKSATFALIIGSPYNSMSSWIRGRRPVHPTAARMLGWLISGYRPRDWHMTGPAFAQAAVRLGLEVEELAEILDAEPDTIVKWSSDFSGPPRMVATAMRWMEDGYRPPQWPQGKV